MYKIFVFLCVISMIACNKKNDSPNNGFNDIFPQIAGKWKAIKYEEKTTTGPRGSERDTLIVNNNINDKGVRCIGFDSLNMIDFISRDTMGFKEGKYNQNSWFKSSTNDVNDRFYIDWYRNQVLYYNGGGVAYKIVINNNNLQIRRDDSPLYYRTTYFERPK